MARATDELKREWGIRLRLARQALGLTQEELCDLTKPAEPKTYSAWERGLNTVDIFWLARLYEACRINPDYILIGRTDDLPAKVEKKIRERLRE